MIYTLFQFFTSYDELPEHLRNIKRSVILRTNDEAEAKALTAEIEQKIARLSKNEIERAIVDIYSFGFVLDIGCGKNKMGDVGIDAIKTDNVDVIALAEFLPFRNDAFDCVLAHHVLEHVPHFRVALWEMRRVARSFAIIVVPRYDHGFAHPGHLHHFKQNELKEILLTGFDLEDVFTVCSSSIFLCQKARKHKLEELAA